MSDHLNKNLFLIKEHTGILKAANNYDVHDPETGEIIFECREPKLGFITKMLRFTDYKRMTPFEIYISDLDGKTLIKVTRGISIFLSNVIVSDGKNKVLGSFQQRLFSIGGKFDVLNFQERSVCKLVGKWTGWDFRFKSETQEFAHVSKKWAGLGKELFTSADNYVLQINESVPAEDDNRKLIIAAVMCIDMVLKE